MKELKLKELKKSYDEGLLTKAEYEKTKKKLEAMPTEKREEKKDEPKEVSLKSDRTLILGVILLVILFASIFGIRYFNQETPETIEDLHILNLKGKLKPDQGYVYGGLHSFVRFEDLWYTQLMSPQGTRQYNIQFRYGPNELEDIDIEGKLDSNLFNKVTGYYVTFDPTGQDFSHVALAVSDFNQHMINIFFKQPIAACDRNETFACRDRPIITCDNTDGIVLYVKEANHTRVEYDENCIIVEGNGFDLLKGIDRVLFDFYGVME